MPPQFLFIPLLPPHLHHSAPTSFFPISSLCLSNSFIPPMPSSYLHPSNLSTLLFILPQYHSSPLTPCAPVVLFLSLRCHLPIFILLLFHSFFIIIFTMLLHSPQFVVHIFCHSANSVSMPPFPSSSSFPNACLHCLAFHIHHLVQISTPIILPVHCHHAHSVAVCIFPLFQLLSCSCPSCSSTSLPPICLSSPFSHCYVLIFIILLQLHSSSLGPGASPVPLSLQCHLLIFIDILRLSPSHMPFQFSSSSLPPYHLHQSAPMLFFPTRSLCLHSLPSNALYPFSPLYVLFHSLLIIFTTLLQCSQFVSHIFAILPILFRCIPFHLSHPSPMHISTV